MDVKFDRIMRLHRVPKAPRGTIWLLAQAYGYKTIAQKRGRSLRTVKKHVSQAFACFDVNSREDLSDAIWRALLDGTEH